MVRMGGEGENRATYLSSSTMLYQTCCEGNEGERRAPVSRSTHHVPGSINNSQHARTTRTTRAPRTHDTHARTHARDHTQRSTVRREKQVGSITSYHIMSVDDKWKEGNKLLLLVRGDLEQLETGKDTSVFLQGIQLLPLLLSTLSSILLNHIITCSLKILPSIEYSC